MQHADHLTFVSHRDREDLLGDEPANATVVPNGVDLAFWQRTGRERGHNTIIFTGAMHYQPNTDAALLLIDEIFPHVQETVPEARLLIVGRDPTPELVRATHRPGVTVTGWVDDVRPYLERATVFVAPLRFGAGMQNKLLEAMAMEVPVIASPLAADGLRTEAGARPPVALAEQPEDFTRLIIEKLTEGNHDRTPDQVARCYVKTYFEWQRSAAKLDQILRNATCLKKIAHYAD